MDVCACTYLAKSGFYRNVAKLQQASYSSLLDPEQAIRRFFISQYTSESYRIDCLEIILYYMYDYNCNIYD